MGLAKEDRVRERQVAASKQETLGQLPSIFSAPNSWDAWRHERFYELLRPLVAGRASESWLTIGDSGADAFWVKRAGAAEVTASSLTDTKLVRMKKGGAILEGIATAAVDAQNIQFSSDAFDYVMCKEAFHHFERPALGIYEMLRVCKQAAVFLGEPDGGLGQYPLDKFKRIVKVVLRRRTGAAHPEFEADGNFIFPLSVLEIVRMATALQTGPIYFRRMNDFWAPQLVYNDRSSVLSGALIKLAVAAQDLLAHLKLMSWGKVTVMVFRGEPDEVVDRALRKSGMRRVDIPLNPYI